MNKYITVDEGEMYMHHFQNPILKKLVVTVMVSNGERSTREVTRLSLPPRMATCVNPFTFVAEEKLCNFFVHRMDYRGKTTVRIEHYPI